MSAKIVRLPESQISAAAATLARAFHDDPLMVYTIPDPADRARMLPGVYAPMIRFGFLAGEIYATASADAPEGVALWLPPNAKWTRENIEASGMHLLTNLIGNEAYQRYREVVGREWQARERDMPEACWYLLLLGVEPGCQRRGLGGALMRPILQRADAVRLACYLETEKERNVAFYMKQGFDMIVNGEEAGTSGVRFWTFR
ncbi:MAG: GNAT family N-acetyltransferase, partial [Candidatus Binataceae bacterium]